VLSTYALEDGNVYLTYSTTARGLEFMPAYAGAVLIWVVTSPGKRCGCAAEAPRTVRRK
jgi:hypothetical protein